MSGGFLNTLVLTGFGVAFLHAALPTHWLPFVLAARGQGWGRAKTLTVTAIAGLGHILFTIVLGLLVLWVGLATQHLTGNVFPVFAGGLLILFGAYFLIRQQRSGGHGHHHSFGLGGHHDDRDHLYDTENQGHRAASRAKMTDKAVILGLFALLTLSPCEAFLPIYLSGLSYGWSGFLVLSAVLAVATLAGMVLFTWLTLAGLEHLRFSVLERYESGILGGLLILLGIAIVVFER